MNDTWSLSPEVRYMILISSLVLFQEQKYFVDTDPFRLLFVCVYLYTEFTNIHDSYNNLSHPPIQLISNVTSPLPRDDSVEIFFRDFRPTDPLVPRSVVLSFPRRVSKGLSSLVVSLVCPSPVTVSRSRASCIGLVYRYKIRLSLPFGNPLSLCRCTWLNTKLSFFRDLM